MIEIRPEVRGSGRQVLCSSTIRLAWPGPEVSNIAGAPLQFQRIQVIFSHATIHGLNVFTAGAKVST